ncbi:hypothetical protein FW774_04620 (plasmid) [Pedobacter sp. BS3]|uniref:hypothetical protein n=1 Tax=Pedobacter sp. BS3 TaxID=2567937 RepID=UPI0011ECE393|nr:hypothetical protein [Pedobacter sp. BS3]TZF86335.1 hypothetical protein FW774_04620 [Pedobacter sp. BS3]
MRQVQKEDSEQKSPAKRFLFILGLFVATVYIILGLLILLKKDFLPGLNGPFRSVFGGVLIFYALFRLSRIVQNRSQER